MGWGGAYLWNKIVSKSMCTQRHTFSKTMRFFTMFQKYVSDVIRSYQRYIFVLEQIHTDVVLSYYKYGGDANKCGFRTVILAKQSHFFCQFFKKKTVKFWHFSTYLFSFCFHVHNFSLDTTQTNHMLVDWTYILFIFRKRDFLVYAQEGFFLVLDTIIKMVGAKGMGKLRAFF